LPTEYIYLQSYRESIYHYVVHQPPELWRRQVLLFDFSSHMKSFCLEGSHNTTPMVFSLGSEDYPALRYSSEQSERTKTEWDRQFLAIAEESTKSQQVSAVYLVGEGFKDEWARDSLKYLARSRRVFQGNNLYSKGACYGGMERVKPSEISKKTVFLGLDKLKSNIGMRLLRGGQESYFAVLDAGVNWYECDHDFEIILDDEAEIKLIVTSLLGGFVSERLFALEGLPPERPPRTTRLHLHITLKAADTAHLTVTDLGFGDLYPATGQTWEWEFEV
jgi:hypothetical protein